MLILPGTGTKMNTEVVAGGAHDTEHNQGVFLVTPTGTRLSQTADGAETNTQNATTYAASAQLGDILFLTSLVTAGAVFELVELRVSDFSGALVAETHLCVMTLQTSMSDYATFTDGTVKDPAPSDSLSTVIIRLEREGSVGKMTSFAMHSQTATIFSTDTTMRFAVFAESSVTTASGGAGTWPLSLTARAEALV